MLKETKFSILLDKYVGRDFLVYCPGKNILEWQERVNNLVAEKDLLVIGSNRVTDLIVPNFHLFTNNEKYENYGHFPDSSSSVMLGSHIKRKPKHKPKYRSIVRVDYTDRDKTEPMGYDKKRGVIEGYYRTSGNLAIMMCHLMGARHIYVAGMSGFTFEFDGNVHYYAPEIGRDTKKKKEWINKYDKPVTQALSNLKAYGIDFKIITPTRYTDHYDRHILEG
jgi:hypothetical protein